MKIPKHIKFSTTKTSDKFTKNDKTIEQFENYLKKKFETTTSGREITRTYIHTLLSYGHLPRKMGGNNLFIHRVRNIVAIRLLKSKHQFNVGGGKFDITQKKRGPKKSSITKEENNG